MAGDELHSEMDVERALVKAWAETGRQLEAIRWGELQTLDVATALSASRALIDAALRVPMPERRVTWSGLVDQQDLFHRRQSS